MSVQRSQSSIKRGQAATYIVKVSTQNGSASDVSVALTAQPSSQKPVFSSGCAEGDGTASCSVGSVTTEQPVILHAKIAVASNATSVSSVKLTATASVVTTTQWTPPAAAQTTAVTAAVPPKSAKPSKSANPPSFALNLPVLPLGPIPSLNGEASTSVGPGNAAALFPTINTSRAASPAPTAAAQPSKPPSKQPSKQPSRQKAGPASDASPVSLGTRVFTAQGAGLIALGLAIMLTVTRLSLRRRSGRPRS